MNSRGDMLKSIHKQTKQTGSRWRLEPVHKVWRAMSCFEGADPDKLNKLADIADKRGGESFWELTLEGEFLCMAWLMTMDNIKPASIYSLSDLERLLKNQLAISFAVLDWCLAPRTESESQKARKEITCLTKKQHRLLNRHATRR